MEKKVILGSDHAGYRLKEELKKFLREAGYAVDDKGTTSEKSVDYPDYAARVAQDAAAGKGVGIVICGSGIGSSIAANKVPGARAALCYNEYAAEMARQHNDANVLALGARVLGTELAKAISLRFLQTGFSGDERHARRIRKIGALERAS